MLIGLPSAEWSPRILFAAGEQGAWYDLSDTSTVWGDIARTSPAAAGDTVAVVDDKSGRGNNMVQATVSKQPIYQIDGTGRPYLEFDGTDDSMQTTAFAAGSNAAQSVMGINKLRSATGVGVTLFEFSTNSNTDNGSLLFNHDDFSALNTIQARSRGTSGSLLTTFVGAVPTGLRVIGLQSNIATPRIELFSAISSLASSATTQGTGNYGTWQLNLSSRNGTANFAQWRLYGGILRFGTNLSPASWALANRWMARRTGISF